MDPPAPWRTETEDMCWIIGTIPGPEPPNRSCSFWRKVPEILSISSWESP